MGCVPLPTERTGSGHGQPRTECVPVAVPDIILYLIRRHDVFVYQATGLLTGATCTEAPICAAGDGELRMSKRRALATAPWKEWAR